MTKLIVQQEKQLDNLIQAGYDQFSTRWREPGQTKTACDYWLEAWELTKQMVTPGIHSTAAFDEMHPTLKYPLSNWLSDLEMELHNAGLADARYFDHRIHFVHEYLTHFPNVDGDGYVNLKRAEGEALWLLDRQTEAEAVYQALVDKLPDHAWGYIGWADQYNWRAGGSTNYERAEYLLKQALDRPELDDRKSVLERFIDLYTHWKRLVEIPPLQAELIELMEAENKQLQQETEILQKFIQSQRNAQNGQSTRSKKLGRNDPCWCGSGEKYKKCHLKQDKEKR